MRKGPKPKNRIFTGMMPEIGDYVYWRFQGLWVGHLEKYPEYLSQGETRAELEEGLWSIYDLIKSDP
jgi:hypothetical protein